MHGLGAGGQGGAAIDYAFARRDAHGLRAGGRRGFVAEFNAVAKVFGSPGRLDIGSGDESGSRNRSEVIAGCVIGPHDVPEMETDIGVKGKQFHGIVEDSLRSPVGTLF